MSGLQEYGFSLGKPAGDGEEDSAVSKAAEISSDSLYRYFLIRYWGPRDHSVVARLLIFVMLNPSTADAVIDDPTIRRCISFAKREGYDGILVVNLFAYRSPKPEIMKSVTDPIGPDNDKWLRRAFNYARKYDIDVLAAWGIEGPYRDRDYEVAEIARQHGLELKCLGKTDGGNPRHPLFVKGTTPFQPLVAHELAGEPA